MAPERCEHLTLPPPRKGQKQSAANRRKVLYRTLPPGRCPPPPETCEDAVKWSSWATMQVATGQLDARTAREIAGLLRVFVAAVSKSELEKRIRDLEKMVKRAKKVGAL